MNQEGWEPSETLGCIRRTLSHSGHKVAFQRFGNKCLAVLPRWGNFGKKHVFEVFRETLGNIGR